MKRKGRSQQVKETEKLSRHKVTEDEETDKSRRQSNKEVDQNIKIRNIIKVEEMKTSHSQG